MRRLVGRRQKVWSLAFSLGGRYLVAGGYNLTAWDLQRAKVRAVALAPQTAYMHVSDQLHFLSDTVLVALLEPAWQRIDLVAGTSVELSLLPFSHPACGTVDPAHGVLKCANKYDDWFDVVTCPITPEGLGAPISTKSVGDVLRWPLVFAPGGARYAAEDCGRFNTEIKHYLCDPATDAVVVSFDRRADDSFLSRVWKFAPDGQTVYAHTVGRILAYDCQRGGLPVAEVALPAGGELRALAAHPGGRLLATVEDDRAVTLRRADSLEVVRRYDFDMPKLTAVAFSPDGLLCAVGNSRGKVLLFDVED